VTITGGFWGRRQTTNRVVSLPSGFVSLERAGTLENFRLVTGHGDAEEHRGEYFVDSDVYKWLEAVGWELGRGIDDDHAARLRVLADQAIALVERAQDGDGYLDTWFQVRAPDLRFTDLPAAHELYCAGHLFQAAVAWWRGVGDDRLLAVAGRLADHIGGVFGPERRQGLPGHPEVEMALVELYRTTGKQAYLDLARFFVDERGHRLLGEVHYGARYRQDDEPFRTAKQARGHAVRQAYLACGALDVAAETGDCALLDAAVAQWEDMVARRMYLTGGVGSRHKDEAFGDPFELPPDRAYAETCAAIGVVMWSWRLLLATGDCRYADMIERALFNGFVVGLSLEGDTYFYVNPLQVRAGRADPEDGRGRAARSGWFDIACCPPNVMRTLASLQHYLATATETGVQLWQFAPSHLSVDVAAGRVELSVDTDYPLNGLISVRVDAATPGPLEIALRVPDWATGATGHLQRLSLDFYESEMAGRVMTRMTTDVDQFESLIEEGVLTALVSMVTFVGVGVALILINAELGLLTLTVVLPLAVATVAFRRRAARLYDAARERIAIVNSAFQEAISGVRVAQAFVHESETAARFHALGQNYFDSRIAAQRLVAVYFPFVQFLSAVADAIVLGAGADLIAHGHLTTGTLIAFILYIDMFFSPIQQLSQVFDAWQQTTVSVSRISDLMQLDTLTPEADEPVAARRLRGQLTLDNVRFSYRPSPLQARRAGEASSRRGPKDARDLRAADALLQKLPQAIRGIDLHIAAGETVALVGETGAGKSTFMKLLARFYDPDSGAVRVDGQDLRTLDLHDFRSQLGYVPQEAFLFSASVRDNIAYGRPDATDADIERAARAVGAHDFVAALPGGYLHELSERGRSLSAGQRQLLALARAELVDPAILLLDEATSNLDLATEARLAAAMDQVSNGRTTIVIAHRLQTARAADRIVVLHAGTIAESGTHDELRARGGRYAAMWDAFETVNRDGPPNGVSGLTRRAGARREGLASDDDDTERCGEEEAG
jgi:ABC-type multidrug transport system fused ATPase/permease subunit/DUF1680 family protein